MPIKNYTSQILIVLLIGAAFTIGLFWQKIQVLENGSGSEQIAGTQQGQPPAEPPAGDVPPVSEADHVRGDENAPIAWIEYSDLECPYCATIHTSLERLIGEYDGQVKWVYRHFPLDQIHPNARKLAIGAECAAETNGAELFWAYVDFVFENNSTDAEAVATALGIGSSAFSACLSSEDAANKVENDYNSGISAGVRGTPGNFVIGPDGEVQSIPGALPYEQLKAVVDGML